jgi:hypothetical protein
MNGNIASVWHFNQMALFISYPSEAVTAQRDWAVDNGLMDFIGRI